MSCDATLAPRRNQRGSVTAVAAVKVRRNALAGAVPPARSQAASTAALAEAPCSCPVLHSASVGACNPVGAYATTSFGVWLRA